MANSVQHESWNLNPDLRAATAALTIAILFALTLVLTPSAQAQTFTIIHNFSGGADGQVPEGDLTLDRAGNLYGTAAFGGAKFYGVVFKLSHSGSGWTFNALHDFAKLGGTRPTGGVAFGPDGSLFGTTTDGDGEEGNGTVLNLRPPATACKAALCPWADAVVYRFKGGSAGAAPGGAVIFDQTGNAYGMSKGGTLGTATVFQLSHSGSGWTETVLHDFAHGYSDLPGSGLVFDSSGNLYGTYYGILGLDNGSVFEMTPSNGGWTYSSLHDFAGGDDGAHPLGTLIMDRSGNLYGTTSAGGTGQHGTVFEMSPSNGGWTFNTIYTFDSVTGPYAGLVMDAAGNLYGTTIAGGAFEVGTVFELSPSNGGWIYTDLHDFTGGDGRFPVSKLVLDAKGNIYGTAPEGGTGCSPNGCGVVFEITP